MTSDPYFWFNVINVGIVVGSLAITIALMWPENME